MLTRLETLQFARGFWRIEDEIRLVSGFLTNSLLQHKSTTENTGAPSKLVVASR
ncbi:hypothetical protein METP2_03760 [Methanosarcinales archaeon]|nr:hypothetical protein METP2_03760 [Methanosarcinales archaeon]